MTPTDNVTIPTLPGTAFAGGFYAGRIAIAGQTYALVVAPKEGGETRLPWKTEWTSTPGAQSLNDGFANSEAMNDAQHPAAQWCRGLTIGGHSDWYLPSRDELEVLYRNLKPGTWKNTSYRSRLKWFAAEAGQYNGVDGKGNGHNAHSVPAGRAYTKDNPTQTTDPAFQAGGPEAFAEGWYWSSTEFGPDYAWMQGFGGGTQLNDDKNYEARCRAVRKVLI